MELLNEIYGKLKNDKIKINWNKKPIKMGIFLGFLNIEVIKSEEHLGSTSGWTQHYNRDLNLIIRGGIINRVEYLDSIQFGTKISNRYNNYVNPFFLYEIMNEEGLNFFKNYYSEEITKIVADVSKNMSMAEAEFNEIKTRYDKIKHLGK